MVKAIVTKFYYSCWWAVIIIEASLSEPQTSRTALTRNCSYQVLSTWSVMLTACPGKLTSESLHGKLSSSYMAKNDVFEKILVGVDT